MRPIVCHCLSLFGHLSFVFKESNLQGRELRSILVYSRLPKSTVNSLVIETVANSRIDLLIDYSAHFIDFIIELIVFDTLVITLVIVIAKYSYVDLTPRASRTTCPPRRPALPPTVSSTSNQHPDPRPHLPLVSSFTICQSLAAPQRHLVHHPPHQPAPFRAHRQRSDYR